MKSKLKMLGWALVAWLMYWLVALLRLSFKLTEDRLPPEALEQHAKNKAVVFGHFHEDDWPMICSYYYRPMIVLVSLSKDGSLLTLFLKRLGYRIARGSSSRGSVQGFKQLVDISKKSGILNAALAVDGPRGPRRKIKKGILRLAHILDSPIIFGIGECSGCHIAKSWAKTIIPKPFARIHLRYVVALNAEEVRNFVASKRESDAIALMESRLKAQVPHLRQE